MHDLSFSAVDVLVVLTLIVSTALAIWRGFVRETLSIFAWAAAAFATLYFGPPAAALLRERISTPYLGSLIAYGGMFLLVLIPLSFVSFRFSESVKHSPVGAIDRSLGAAFGVIRGLAVVGLSYLLFSMIVPIPRQPLWITQARLLPVIQSSSDVLLSMVPARNAARMAATSATSAPDTPVPRPRPSTATHHTNKAYGTDERRALDRLIQSTGGGGNNRP
jgi:membrane protein required for colicin V production